MDDYMEFRIKGNTHYYKVHHLEGTWISFQ
uniref:Uncharacterized protein n=1 Tax=Rhizophora mucronata TaxID=61149 RepID=A0A2P2R048_RHIMU